MSVVKNSKHAAQAKRLLSSHPPPAASADPVAAASDPPLAAPLAQHWEARRSSRNQASPSSTGAQPIPRPAWSTAESELVSPAAARRRSSRKDGWDNAFGGCGDDIALRQGLQAQRGSEDPPKGVAFHVDI